MNPDAEDGATPLNVGVERVIIHPGYSSAPVINDIALIQLQNKVQFTSTFLFYYRKTYFRQLVEKIAVKLEAGSV